MNTHPFDPGHILGSLVAHDVRFVVIGGIAARLLGSPTVTNDLDICHAATADNLERLSAALTELRARLRGVNEKIRWFPTPETLAAADSFTLATVAGNLDALARPAGATGYDQLAATATPLDVGGLTVLVAHIEDLIRLKRAAGRPKDLIEVEVLGALLEEMGDWVPVPDQQLHAGLDGIRLGDIAVPSARVRECHPSGWMGVVGHFSR